jgi:hypothetical protein
VILGRIYNRTKKNHGSEPGTNRRDGASGQNEHLQKPERTASAIAKEFARLRSPRSPLFSQSRPIPLPDIFPYLFLLPET